MSKRPNILVIMTDQQRRDSIGCYGADWVATPNLDRLAAEGTRFTRCTVNNPICTPSRASIMTGRELPGHGVYRLHDVLPDDQILFPERLRRDGDYRTALFGKLHVSGRAQEEEQRHPHDGFEVYEWAIESCVSLDSRFNGYAGWLRDRDPAFLADLDARGRKVLHHPEPVHFTHWAAERTAAYIRAQADRNEPFFCMMSIFDPHNPYDGYPEAMAGRVKRGLLPAALPQPQGREPEVVRRERDGGYLGHGFSPKAIEDMRFGYAASLAFVDQEVGGVLAALEETGLAGDTLVIYASDHGDSLGDHGLFAKGAALYEHAIGVPMILRWPGHVPAGAVSEALVQTHDIARTCVAAAGVDWPRTPEAFDTGRDLVAVARGSDPGRDFAVTAYRNSGINDQNRYWDPPMKATSVTTPRHKLVAYGSGDAVDVSLFDLDADPLESTDLFGDPALAGTTAELFGHLSGWLQREAGHGGSRGGSRPPAVDRLMDNALPRT